MYSGGFFIRPTLTRCQIHPSHANAAFNLRRISRSMGFRRLPLYFPSYQVRGTSACNVASCGKFDQYMRPRMERSINSSQSHRYPKLRRQMRRFLPHFVALALPPLRVQMRRSFCGDDTRAVCTCMDTQVGVKADEGLGGALRRAYISKAMQRSGFPAHRVCLWCSPNNLSFHPHPIGRPKWLTQKLTYFGNATSSPPKFGTESQNKGIVRYYYSGIRI